MSRSSTAAWVAAAKRALTPYFADLDSDSTLIVQIERTARLYDDDEEKIERARTLMEAAAAGAHRKRRPLEARVEANGTYTILDGKSTHACLERLGIGAVPLVVVEGARQPGPADEPPATWT